MEEQRRIQNCTKLKCWFPAQKSVTLKPPARPFLLKSLCEVESLKQPKSKLYQSLFLFNSQSGVSKIALNVQSTDFKNFKFSRTKFSIYFPGIEVLGTEIKCNPPCMLAPCPLTSCKTILSFDLKQGALK